MLSLVEIMIKAVVECGGFTITADGITPAIGYAVAVRGHNVQIPARLPDAEKIRILEVFAAAADRDSRAIGGWYDTEHDEICLDLVEIFQDRDAAIAAGRNRNQIAIYDLLMQEEISTGGTGDREPVLADLIGA